MHIFPKDLQVLNKKVVIAAVLKELDNKIFVRLIIVMRVSYVFYV
tara:strand:- start:111 stop:245 length:135 start_codon:yes stop_codon:yes gene_type:complete